MMKDLNRLIGIPFKLNRKDFGGCDCRGIVWLYHKYIKNQEIPFSDGKRIFFRNRKDDVKRMLNILSQIGSPVSFEELKESDIVILKTRGDIGALGVCINTKQLLHMDKVVGSCLTKLRYLKDLFLYGYRLND